MSKEQTPITAEEWYKVHTENDLIRKKYSKYDFSTMEQYAQDKVLEAQNELIQDIKEKVAKMEETTTIQDFPFDVLHLLKTIKPIKK